MPRDREADAARAAGDDCDAAERSSWPMRGMAGTRSTSSLADLLDPAVVPMVGQHDAVVDRRSRVVWNLFFARPPHRVTAPSPGGGIDVLLLSQCSTVFPRTTILVLVPLPGLRSGLSAAGGRRRRRTTPSGVGRSPPSGGLRRRASGIRGRATARLVTKYFTPLLPATGSPQENSKSREFSLRPPLRSPDLGDGVRERVDDLPRRRACWRRCAPFMVLPSKRSCQPAIFGGGELLSAAGDKALSAKRVGSKAWAEVHRGRAWRETGAFAQAPGSAPAQRLRAGKRLFSPAPLLSTRSPMSAHAVVRVTALKPHRRRAGRARRELGHRAGRDFRAVSARTARARPPPWSARRARA